MKRTQIQLEESTWQVLRERAFREKSSIAALIRQILQAQPSQSKRRHKLRMKDFSFVGSGTSKGKRAGTISERHDEEFADSIL